jgi:signal transduction histidine kinase
MGRVIRHISLVKSILVVTALSALGTAIMVHLDAFDKFYLHSRQFEYFDYDEIVVFMTFFLLLGLLCMSFRLYRAALAGEAKPHVSEDLSSHIPEKNRPWEKLRQGKLITTSTYESPLLLLVSLILLIGVVEILDMILLGLFLPLPFPLEVFVDAGILIGVISPALYFIFFRPMQRQFIIRQQTEQALNQCNLELETRVIQRTAQLSEECAERKRAEEKLIENQKQLRALSSELVLVEDRERKRIATDLHDNVGHSLALAKNKLGLLQASIPANHERKLLENINALIDNSIHFSRSLIFELSSPLLDFLSFESAVEWLSEDILGKNQIRFNLVIDDSPKSLTDELRIPLLRAIRELLVNIVKHAEATNVEMTVHTTADELCVEIEDDGTGFEVPDQFSLTAGQKGLGLFSVSERLSRMQGRCSIRSKPGQGTHITLAVPVQERGKREIS